MRLEPAGRIDPGAPFAWHPDGETIALVSGKLLIENRATGGSTTIDAAPSAIAWSPDGAILATASVQGKSSVLRLFGLNGSVKDETAVPGHVARLAWRSGTELIAAGLSLERFKFGSNLKIVLYRWQRGAPPAETSLSDVTIMPARVRRYETDYYHAFSFDLSPYGDEIAYTRLIEPPNFPSYMKMVVRHLVSGAEKEAPGVKNGTAGAVYSSDGEHLLYGDSTGRILQLAPWTAYEREILSTPGHALALSPSDRYLFADGRLYLDGREIAAFPPGCEGAFPPDGSKLLLRCDDSLSILSGLNRFTPSVVDPGDRERFLELRKWRSEGLISDQEYQSQKQRILDK